MAFRDIIGRMDSAVLRTYRETATYLPDGGKGDPLTIRCVLNNPAEQQSASPGFFAEIQVDPSVVTDPRKGDVVIWTDDVAYVVGRVNKPAYGLTSLSLHRQNDRL
jgi:hypothetical protein